MKYRIIRNTHPHPHYQVQKLYKILWWGFWWTCSICIGWHPFYKSKFNSIEEAEQALRQIKHRDGKNMMTVAKEEK